MVEIKLSFDTLAEAAAFLNAGRTIIAPSTMTAGDLPKQVALEKKLIAKRKYNKRVAASVADAQPEVAENTGSDASDPSVLPFAEGVAVDEDAGSLGDPGEDQPASSSSENDDDVIVAPTPAPGKTPVKIDEVRTALSAVNAKQGLEAARGLLAKFGAARISDLQETDYWGFLQACKELG